MMSNFFVSLFLLCFPFAFKGLQSACREEELLQTHLPGSAMIVLHVPQGAKSANREPNQCVSQFTVLVSVDGLLLVCFWF